MYYYTEIYLKLKSEKPVEEIRTQLKKLLQTIISDKDEEGIVVTDVEKSAKVRYDRAEKFRSGPDQDLF